MIADLSIEAQPTVQPVPDKGLVIIVERVDDVALLIGQMVRMGLPEILDSLISRHGRQRELSWGWT